MAECAGANFFLDFKGEPVCTLHAARAARDAEMPVAVLFGMRRFCMPRDEGKKWKKNILNFVKYLFIFKIIFLKK